MTRNAPNPARQVVAGALFLAIVVAVALLGSLATTPNTDGWYAEVQKVAWNPPNWLFGPVWSVIYLAIAMSGFLIWRAGFAGAGVPNRARRALGLYVTQMVLNFVWTPLFFAAFPVIGPSAWWIALAVIVLLIVSVALLIPAAGAWSRTAAWLLVPYLGWLIFASTLNAGIIALN